MKGFPNPPGELILLKLGGSLITDKKQARTLRRETLARLAGEIAAAVQQRPSLKLVIGHGAGSFAHVSAKRHGTRQGVRGKEEWQGFAEVWWDAAVLNRLVVDAFREVGLPTIALPPSAAVIAKDGQVERWDLGPLQAALRAGLFPVIHGDVIFDSLRGGTILSTEDLFSHLALQLHPGRMLLAGIESGVWKDFPSRTNFIPKITPKNFQELMPVIGGSAGTDVTGGMLAKVEQCVALSQELPGIEILIFSADEAGILLEVLLGTSHGTLISDSED
jgi:isopentenyl phosphate kinase